MTRHFILITALIATISPACLMAKGSAIVVRGNVSLASSAGTTTSIALSHGALASTSTGSVTNAHIGGSLKTTASAGAQTAVAISPYARARTFVGSVDGVSTGRSVRANGSVRSITAIAARPGSSVCASIGSVGAGGGSASGHAGNVLVYDFGFWRKTRYRQGNSGVVC